VVRAGNPEAYAAYLAGKALLYRRTREGFRDAVVQFERAIALDSSYSPAYAGLATVYSLWAYYAYPGVDYYETSGKAARLLDRAVELDSLSGEALGARGRVLTRAWAPSAVVEADFQRALTLLPNSSDVHQWYALFLAREGRHAEMLAESDRALALDPLAPGARIAASNMTLVAGDVTGSRQEADRVLALEPGLARARELQALDDLLLKQFERCLTVEPGPGSLSRAMCLHSMGRVGEAETAVGALRAAYTATSGSGSGAVGPARGLARYYAWTGNAAESLAWLERVYAISPEGEDLVVIASGIYDKVRKDPRFSAGLARIHTQIHERIERERSRS
jgi:tetratricopeptide (TPR) repeat protein